MSVIQPFQFLRFSKFIGNQLRFQEGYNNDLCDIPVIPQGSMVPFAIIAPSNVIGDVSLLCHNEEFKLYYNTEISGIFTKNNCGSMAGSDVTYTVEAAKYSSSVSQYVVDLQAANDLAANGQAYANLHGTCSGFHFVENFDSLGDWVFLGTAVTESLTIESNKLRCIATGMDSPCYVYLPNCITNGLTGKTYRLTIKVDELTISGPTTCRLGFLNDDGMVHQESIISPALEVEVYDTISSPMVQDFKGIMIKFNNFGTSNVDILIDYITIDEV